MRRISILLAAAVASGGLVTLTGLGTAHAQCPGEDGTVPGSSASMTPIGADDGTNGQTIFVDDRDFADADDDGDTGGLWTYIEDNSTPGLTRGGDQIIFSVANPPIPFVPPVEVLPADPNRPVAAGGLTLFPDGLGGGSLAELAGEHDDCDQTDNPATPEVEGPATPDAILQ